MPKRLSSPAAVPTLLLLLAVGTAAVLACGQARSSGKAAERPWNILIVLTDDQRFDTLWSMPRVERLLVEPGTLFANTFASNPICCPFRSSLLSGGFYSHNTNVLTAALPNGGVTRFVDRETLPVALKRQGYRTGLIGKYMNGLRRLAPHIPPGWDRFVGSTRINDWHHPEFLEGASTVGAPGQGRLVVPDAYITYFERDQALAFLERYAGEPFFLLLATDAPHLPAQPAGRDLKLFSDWSYHGRGSGEKDLADKPRYVRELAGRGEDSEGDGAAERLGEDFPVRQLRTLRAVDRAVEQIVGTLRQKGVLDHTVIFFSSDNGMLWGEHGLARKGLPYEESARVPLVVRFPGGKPGRREELVAADLDIPATVQELAGLPHRGDGRSLLGLLRGSDPGWRSELLLEGFGFEADHVPAWAALRGTRYKYVEYADGESELYDLAKDPFELDSLAPARRPPEVVGPMAARLAGEHGLALATESLPPAAVGKPLRVPLATWGGTPPFAWTVARGSLPPGVALGAGGVLAGTPTAAGTYRWTVEVRDSSRSPFHGEPKSFLRIFDWIVQ